MKPYVSPSDSIKTISSKATKIKPYMVNNKIVEIGSPAVSTIIWVHNIHAMSITIIESSNALVFRIINKTPSRNSKMEMSCINPTISFEVAKSNIIFTSEFSGKGLHKNWKAFQFQKSKQYQLYFKECPKEFFKYYNG
jgi:hypothetical protein